MPVELVPFRDEFLEEAGELLAAGITGIVWRCRNCRGALRNRQ